MSDFNPMSIALDYDDCYNSRLKPILRMFVKSAIEAGHRVVIVTARMGDIHHSGNGDVKEDAQDLGVECIFTQYSSKREYCKKNHDFYPDIWIDDMPEFIVHDIKLYHKKNTVTLLPRHVGW